MLQTALTYYPEIAKPPTLERKFFNTSHIFFNVNSLLESSQYFLFSPVYCFNRSVGNQKSPKVHKLHVSVSTTLRLDFEANTNVLLIAGLVPSLLATHFTTEENKIPRIPGQKDQETGNTEAHPASMTTLFTRRL